MGATDSSLLQAECPIPVPQRAQIPDSWLVHKQQCTIQCRPNMDFRVEGQDVSHAVAHCNVQYTFRHVKLFHSFRGHIQDTENISLSLCGKEQTRTSGKDDFVPAPKVGSVCKGEDPFAGARQVFIRVRVPVRRVCILSNRKWLRLVGERSTDLRTEVRASAVKRLLFSSSKAIPATPPYPSFVKRIGSDPGRYKTMLPTSGSTPLTSAVITVPLLSVTGWAELTTVTSKGGKQRLAKISDLQKNCFRQVRRQRRRVLCYVPFLSDWIHFQVD